MSRPALTSAIAPQSLTVTAPVALTVNFTPDFTISISTPPPVSINGTVTFTVTVTGQNGFNDAVTLDAPLLPTGASVTFSQNPVYGSGSTTVTIHAPSTGGTFAFTLRGIAGPASSGLTHGVAGTLAVQDFTVNPLTQLLSGGPLDTVKYVFAFAPLGGFNGAITAYTPTITAHNPLFGAQENCNTVSRSFDPTSFSSPATVTMSMQLGYPCDLWLFDVSVRFQSGTISHTVVVQLQGTATGVFTLSTPWPPPTAINNQVILPIQVTSNFNGTTVNLQMVPNSTVTGLPNYVTVSPGIPANFSLTVNTAGYPPGTWNVIVIGQVGTVTQSLAIPFIVGNTTPPISPSSPRPPP